LGPIGSAVLTFIEYKQTVRQAKNIYMSIYRRHTGLPTKDETDGLFNDFTKKQTSLQLQGIVNIRKQTV